MNSTGGCRSSYWLAGQRAVRARFLSCCLSLSFLRVWYLSFRGTGSAVVATWAPHPFSLSNAMQQVTCEGGEKEEKVELIIHIETYNLGAPLSPLSLLCRMAPSLWASNLYMYTHIYTHILYIFYLGTLVVLSRLFITVFNRNLLPEPPYSWACFSEDPRLRRDALCVKKATERESKGGTNNQHF